MEDRSVAEDGTLTRVMEPDDCIGGPRISMSNFTCNLEGNALQGDPVCLPFEVNEQESHRAGGSNLGRISVRQDVALAIKVLRCCQE